VRPSQRRHPPAEVTTFPESAALPQARLVRPHQKSNRFFEAERIDLLRHPVTLEEK
jgi:hypothetical protein